MTESCDRAYNVGMDLTSLAERGTPLQLDRPRYLVYNAAAMWLLLQKYKDRYLTSLYRLPTKEEEKAGSRGLILQSMDVLVFYLWVGLQADAEAHGEKLDLEQVERFISARTYPVLFGSVTEALMRDNFNPQPADASAGKADAAAARPAVAAKPRPRKGSTGKKPKASRSPSSAGRRGSSGQKR